MAKNIVKINENELHKLIGESVKKMISELDWKTYANASKKSMEKSVPSDFEGGSLADRAKKAMKNRERAKRFGDAARQSFNDQFGYEGDGVQVDMGGDFMSTEEFGPHIRGLKDKGYGRPMRYDHGWNDHELKHQTPEEFFGGDDNAVSAYNKGKEEIGNYKKGKYGYAKGKGWQLNTESFNRKLDSIINETLIKTITKR